jgi:DNA-binding beta-propeller fold protein YncE
MTSIEPTPWSLNVFYEPEYRFAVPLDEDHYLVSCQASNALLVVRRHSGNVKVALRNQFNKPQAMAVSSDGTMVYVVDRFNHCVHVLRRPVKEVWNLFKVRVLGGPGILNQPVGVALDEDGGRLYVADNENHRIAVFSTESGELVESLGDGYGKEVGQLFCPCGVALYKGLVVVAEWGNGRLSVFCDGKAVNVIEGTPHAHDVVVDGDRIHVACYFEKRVRSFHLAVDEDRQLVVVVQEPPRDLERPPTSLLMEGDVLRTVTATQILTVGPADVSE